MSAPPAAAAATRLEALAGNAPQRSANVRELARFAATSTCNLATVGFATRVSFDKLLAGTALAAPFGQSPFAFRRGNRFEELLRKDGHAPMLRLLGESLGYDTAGAQVANVRDHRPRTMAARAEKTAALLRDILGGKPGAANLVDGAVLQRAISGKTQYFEADAVAAQFGAPIHVGEIKSFPTVDGQADPDKIGAAVSQVSIYILLLRELVDRLGGDPDKVSSKALIITTKNTGLQPTLCVKDVGREVDRAARILDQTPSATDLASSIPAAVSSFSAVASGTAEEGRRLDALEEIADAVGTTYRPACLSSCGLSRFCRERAHDSGDPARVGGGLVRLLPGVASLDRANELARGAAPREPEAAVAEQLQRAVLLRDSLVPAHYTNHAKGHRP